jgi:hypothetical protein
MSTKVRKQVYIEPDQEERLKRLAAETGVAEAEIIRQALDRQLVSIRVARRDPVAWAAELEFMRQRAARAAEPGRRTWTREDLYDRKVLRRH